MLRMLRYMGLAVLLGVLLLALGVGGRIAWATSEIARSDAVPVQHLDHIGATARLEVLPLYENAVGDPGLAAGHGVAYLVRTDAATILVDVGYNPDNLDPSPLLHNMAELGVTLDDVDMIVITHPHPDHEGGVTWWQKGTFSLGNTQADLAGKIIYTPEAMSYPGAMPNVADAPTVLAPGVATLGALPAANVFPLNLLTPTIPEQVLAVNVAGEGAVLIVGCGHPGLERIMARAEQVLDAPVIGIVGGLHYGEDTAAGRAAIGFLAAKGMRLVALSPHDSGQPVLDAFRRAFPGVYRDVAVGTPIAIGG